MGSLARLELGRVEAQHLAVLVHRALHTVIKPHRRLSLQLDRDPHLHAMLRGELLDDFVDDVGELFFGQGGVEIDAAVEAAFGGRGRRGRRGRRRRATGSVTGPALFDARCRRAGARGQVARARGRCGVLLARSLFLSAQLLGVGLRGRWRDQQQAGIHDDGAALAVDEAQVATAPDPCRSSRRFLRRGPTGPG